jgi:Restriction endonuclease NaeI
VSDQLDLQLVQQAVDRGLHQAAALDLVAAWCLKFPDFDAIAGLAIRDAIDQVIDTPRTRRWCLEQLHRQELAYLGVRVEIVLRDALSLPPGEYGQDFGIAGSDVDCKWSKHWGGWEIPPEAVDKLCLLVWADDASSSFAIGIFLARNEFLTHINGNRDRKRKIQRPEGLATVRWLVPRGTRLPPNVLLRLPPADRDAILAPAGGDDRMAELFRRCEGVVLKRHVIASVAQQDDPTRRARAMRKRLEPEGLEIFCGYLREQKQRAAELGGPVPPTSDHWVCLRSDGSSAAKAATSGMAQLLWDVA